MSASDSSYDEKGLLRLVAQGDMSAFEELYHRYWQSLFNSAYKRLKNIDQSKDVVQDVFTDLWGRKGTVEIENPSAYLHTAVRFQVYKRIAEGKITSAFTEPFETIATSPFEAEKNVAEKELAELAKTWLDSLPGKRKEIFLLYFVGQLSTKEIADKLNISQKTVQNQLGTAAKSFRRRINLFLISF